MITTYGMSETCGGCVYDGVPLDGVQVRLSAADSLIEISGAVLFSGYLGSSLEGRAPDRRAPDRQAADRQAPDGRSPGGWFRTADLGGWAPDGRLMVRGRADDLINTGGEKVVPGEVEAVLGTCPGVGDVVVVGLPDAEWGEVVTAFVVPADPADPPDLDLLRSNVRQALSVYAAPKRLVVVPEFPLLPSGKPDRLALRRTGLQEV